MAIETFVLKTFWGGKNKTLQYIIVRGVKSGSYYSKFYFTSIVLLARYNRL